MGVVYHANYLKFCERARTEHIAAVGASVMQWAERGIMFPIYSVNMVFRTSAKLGDTLVVITKGKKTSPYRMSFEQRIERPSDEKVIVEGTADCVCTDLQGKLREFPDVEEPMGDP